MPVFTVFTVIFALLSLAPYDPTLIAIYSAVLLQVFLVGLPYQELRRAMALALAVTVLLHAHLFEIKQVKLRSMEPAFVHGDWVVIEKGSHLVASLFPGWQAELYKPGTVVELQLAEQKKPMLKRVGYLVQGQELLWFVIGDNPLQSLDSRNFGPVAFKAIVGRAYKLF